MEKDRQIKLTVFTPAYNRSDMLVRLYESLRAQSSFDFEWLVVDDGSTDDTGSAVAEFHDSRFPVRYFKKENGGKHTAYNMALIEARGDYFICVDSDDTLDADAVRRINDCAGGIPENCGIAAYKTDMSGKMLCGEFHDTDIYTTYSEMFGKYNCRGEYTFIYPTQFAKKFPFPVFDGEKFVTESVIYDRLDSVCRLKLLPYALTVCEYQADGYSSSQNQLMKNNPAGYCLYFMQRIDLAQGFKERLLCAGKYHAFRIFSHGKLRYSSRLIIFTELCRPAGWLFWLYYKIFRGF